MAKFDFNNAIYARLWSDNDIRFLQTYIDDAALLRSNKDFWKSQMTISETVTPTAPDGTATFAVQYEKKELSPMADLRSRLGDSVPLDKEGIAYYAATIPDFIMPGIVENALERADREKRFAEFGNDAALVDAWTQKVQARYDGANSTLSNLTAQLMSTGKMVYNFGRGIHSPLHKADIPTKNFLKAGKKIWSDPNCLLLDQMFKIENDWKMETGNESTPLIWQIPYNMFINVFMKNAQVIQWIKDIRTLNDQATTTNMGFTQEEVLQYISRYNGISPIEIVEEKQLNQGWTTKTTVSGWNPKVAVLRPAGYAGKIQHTDNLDQQLFQAYGSSVITKTFATIDTIFHLVNTTSNNGNYKEWHTDVMFSAIPSLSEFPDHLIIDTTVANS